MKTRILWCGEATVINTGYATYGREVIKRLHETGKFEIAEFSSYISDDDPRIPDIPWKVYGNTPDLNNPEIKALYNANSANQFGQWRFEEVCLDFMPHVVADIRDFWMFSFEDTSPFRPCYNLVWMPTIDAPGQNVQWLATYANIDGIFTYQDWSSKTLVDESGGKIVSIASAPPAASAEFKPIDNREEVKEKLGFGGYNIVGTIMRNQRRKLYPNLFEAFRQYLDTTGDNKTLLYCHTSYPDRGWDIPELILKHGLSSKTLFTYVCHNCGESFPSFFNDALAYCLRCNYKTAACSSVGKGVSNNVLSGILNVFDVYVQYANSEGFGMPQVEAAACGVPVMAVDFSAMSDVVRKLNGIPIAVLSEETELETGCRRAIPDNQDFIDKLKWFFGMPEENRNQLREYAVKGYRENYSSWDHTARKWEEYFDNIDTNYYEKQWHRHPEIFLPSSDVPDRITNSDYARWLIKNVLGDESKLNTFMESRLIRDINYGVTTHMMSGLYFNEMSNLFVSGERHKKFSREDAYDHMKELCERKNYWENERCKKLGISLQIA